MKHVTRLSLALIMFSLFSISQIATAAADDQGQGKYSPQTQGKDSRPVGGQSNDPYNGIYKESEPTLRSDRTAVGKRRGYNGGQKRLQGDNAYYPGRDSGSNYKHLTQPANQGGKKGVASGECTDALRLINDC